MCKTEGRARKQTPVLLKGGAEFLFPRQPSAVHSQSSRRWLAQQGSGLSGQSQTRSFSPPDSRGQSLSPPRPSHTLPWPGLHTQRQDAVSALFTGQFRAARVKQVSFQSHSGQNHVRSSVTVCLHFLPHCSRAMSHYTAHRWWPSPPGLHTDCTSPLNHPCNWNDEEHRQECF